LRQNSSISLSTLAFTTALSKDSETSSTLSTMHSHKAAQGPISCCCPQ
jgi:hypothetical protein